MFSIFKRNPEKKLRKQYDQQLEKAMLAQRNGDMKSYAMITAEAEKTWAEIESLRTKDASTQA
jgi:hypothetical protein